MFESLFGAELPLAVRFLIAFLIVLVLIGLTAWAIRRFGASRLGTGAARGRQPRLAVIDAAAVDGRRRLVLIRRDNVEHLLMIGGPTDVVVEQNIVRAVPVATPREMPMPRGAEPPFQPPAESAPMPPRAARAAPPEEAPWPPPHLPEPEPRPARVARPAPPVEDVPWEPKPAPEPVRPAAMAPPRPVMEPPAPPRPAMEPPRPAAELRPAADFGRPMPPRPAPPPPVVEAAPPIEPPAPPAAEIGLTDMAKRLELALRRPIGPGEPKVPEKAAEADARPSSGHQPPMDFGTRPAEPMRPIAPEPMPVAAPMRAPEVQVRMPDVRMPDVRTPEPRLPEMPRVTEPMPMAAPSPMAAPAMAEPVAVPPEPRPAELRAPAPPEAKPAAAPKSVFDSLEEEMASLLGRPPAKE